MESGAGFIPCGPDVDRIVATADEHRAAGFDRLCISQIGPRQTESFDFYSRELAPALAGIGAAADSDASIIETEAASTP